MKRALAAVACLVACQDEALPKRLPDSDGGLYSPHPVGSPCGFAETTFALPSLVGATSPPLGLLSGQQTCTSSSGSLSWELADMNADGLADLVVTSACDDASVGRTGFLVYPATAAGFGPAVRFALPAIAQTPGCASFALVDVDGDSLVDSRRDVALHRRDRRHLAVARLPQRRGQLRHGGRVVRAPAGRRARELPVNSTSAPRPARRTSPPTPSTT